jgi:hypothetical protein
MLALFVALQIADKIIAAVQLEDPLGDVQTDCGNLRGGRLLQLVALNGPSLAYRCRQGSSTASDSIR